MPDNWTKGKSSNPRVSHCFDVMKNGKNNHILVSTTPFEKRDWAYFMAISKSNLAREIVEHKPNMVEENVIVGELRDGNGIAYYFKATDKTWENNSSNSDDWPVMMRVMYILENGLIEMSVLYHYDFPEIVGQALKVLEKSKRV
jgi:hypothetical protein